jgi:hypothetical protein
LYRWIAPQDKTTGPALAERRRDCFAPVPPEPSAQAEAPANASRVCSGVPSSSQSNGIVPDAPLVAPLASAKAGAPPARRLWPRVARRREGGSSGPSDPRTTLGPSDLGPSVPPSCGATPRLPRAADSRHWPWLLAHRRGYRDGVVRKKRPAHYCPAAGFGGRTTAHNHPARMRATD